LGRTPYIGQTIRKWLAPEHLLSYVESILRVYNMHGRRDNIHKARIKIIVNQMGIDKYRELVDEDWKFTKDGALKVPDDEVARINAYFAPPQYEKLADQTEALEKIRSGDRAFDRWCRGNVVEHKVPGYAIVNLSLKAPGKAPGDITADKMDAVADLADRYSMGEIRVTHRQNLVFVDVKQSELYELWHKLAALELATPNLGLLSDIICCPGLDFCALANARSIPIAQDISRAFTDLDELQKIGQFTINISGCMNACGHHHVGHIGILGVDKRGEEFFQLTLGGSSDQNASLGDRLGPGLPQADVPAAIRKIVDTYLVIREQHERFLDTYRRVGIEPFKSAVYGEESRAA
jgi:sulfite reductase (NADPH) hemoprotein beta-component